MIITFRTLALAAIRSAATVLANFGVRVTGHACSCGPLNAPYAAGRASVPERSGGVRE